MAVSPGDVVRASARLRLPAGQDHINVFYYKHDGASSLSDTSVRQAVTGHLATAYANIETNISNACDVLDVKVDKVEFVGGVLTVIRALGIEPWSGLGFSPTATGESLPPGVAALVKFTTSVTRVLGRKFLGGLVEASQANGETTSGLLSQLASWGAAILAGFTIGGTDDFVSGVMSTKQTDFVQFDAADASDILAYQRRRRQGTGS